MEDDAFVILSNIAIDIPLTKLPYDLSVTLVTRLISIFNEDSGSSIFAKTYLCLKTLMLLCANSKPSASALIQLAGKSLMTLVEKLTKSMHLHHLLPFQELIIGLLHLLIEADQETVTWVILKEKSQECIASYLIQFLFQMNNCWLTYLKQEHLQAVIQGQPNKITPKAKIYLLNENLSHK